MSLKSFLVFALLLTVVSASQIGEFNEKISNPNTNQLHKNVSNCRNRWEKDVEQFYKRCATVANTFPSGPIYDRGQNVIVAIRDYTDKLEWFTRSNSTILSSKSIAILNVISTLKNLSGSPGKMINEFGKLFHPLLSSYMKIVSSLSENIGQLTVVVNKAIKDLESAYDYVLIAVRNIGSGRKDKDVEIIDFASPVRCLLVIINTIALIAKTTLNDCEIVTHDVNEALTVLILILNHFTIIVYGTYVWIEAMLSYKSMPHTLDICILTLGPFLSAVTDSITSIANTIAESLTDFLLSIVSLTNSLNATFNSALGLVGGVAITARQIIRNLLKITNGVSNILVQQ